MAEIDDPLGSCNPELYKPDPNPMAWGLITAQGKITTSSKVFYLIHDKQVWPKMHSKTLKDLMPPA